LLLARNSSQRSLSYVLRLVETGQLALDQSIATILPDIGIDLDGVTVHHLLTHTSGIDDYFDEETMTDFEDVFQDTPMYRLRRPTDFLPLFRDQKRQFTAGERITMRYRSSADRMVVLSSQQQIWNDFGAVS